jgi:hypothetical protein
MWDMIRRTSLRAWAWRAALALGLAWAAAPPGHAQYPYGAPRYGEPPPCAARGYDGRCLDRRPDPQQAPRWAPAPSQAPPQGAASDCRPWESPVPGGGCRQWRAPY